MGNKLLILRFAGLKLNFFDTLNMFFLNPKGFLYSIVFKMLKDFFCRKFVSIIVKVGRLERA